MKTKRLTDSQLQALRDIVRYGDPVATAYGMAQRGGRAHTTQVLLRHGLACIEREEYVEYTSSNGGPGRYRKVVWALTDAGRQSLETGRIQLAEGT